MAETPIHNAGNAGNAGEVPSGPVVLTAEAFQALLAEARQGATPQRERLSLRTQAGAVLAAVAVAFGVGNMSAANSGEYNSVASANTSAAQKGSTYEATGKDKPAPVSRAANCAPERQDVRRQPLHKRMGKIITGKRYPAQQQPARVEQPQRKAKAPKAKLFVKGNKVVGNHVDHNGNIITVTDSHNITDSHNVSNDSHDVTTTTTTTNPVVEKPEKPEKPVVYPKPQDKPTYPNNNNTYPPMSDHEDHDGYNKGHGNHDGKDHEDQDHGPVYVPKNHNPYENKDHGDDNGQGDNYESQQNNDYKQSQETQEESTADVNNNDGQQQFEIEKSKSAPASNYTATAPASNYANTTSSNTAPTGYNVSMTYAGSGQ